MKQPTPTFQGHIAEKGKIKIFAPGKIAMARWINTFKVGTKLELIIRKWHEKRTNEQNAYYWGVVIPILSDHFGYDSEEMHMVLREKFLRIHDDKHPDFVIAKSTAKLNTAEFVEYIEIIQRWASIEHQTYIPDPEKIV